MRVVESELPGVRIVEPRVFGDERGFFLETYSAQRYAEQGINCGFVQDNHSHSAAGVLRGLHYQLDPGAQDKLIFVLRGRIVDVAVDVRPGSPHFGRHVMVELSAENRRQLFVPRGFAHGFFAAEESDVIYKCSDYYRPQLERGIRYDDPRLAIQWPSKSPALSPRDAQLPHLADVAEADLPK